MGYLNDVMFDLVDVFNELWKVKIKIKINPSSQPQNSKPKEDLFP